jgi:hypothetical protein
MRGSKPTNTIPIISSSLFKIAPSCRWSFSELWISESNVSFTSDRLSLPSVGGHRGPKMARFLLLRQERWDPTESRKFGQYDFQMIWSNWNSYPDKNEAPDLVLGACSFMTVGWAPSRRLPTAKMSWRFLFRSGHPFVKKN